MGDEDTILERNECPRCQAPNLASEVCCFACGARLHPLPKRHGGPPAPTPWLLWLGLAFCLAVAVLVFYHAAVWLAAYREGAGLEPWRLPALAVLCAIAGKVAFIEARHRDLRSWRLQRAPQLPLSQARIGDAVWARGTVACDMPVIPAHFPQECAYYRYIVRERGSGEGGWRVTERRTSAVDFRLVDGDRSVYVPSGCVRFDAPLYIETALDREGRLQVKLWAIPVGLPVSLCGRIAGETARPRVDPIADGILGVVTWRTPHDYVALVAGQARWLHRLGYALIAAGVLAAIAGVVTIST